MLKVANIVFNPFKNDSRVLKEAISLNKVGYQVEVIAHGDKGLPAEENLNGVKVIYDAHEYKRETIALRGFKKTAVKFLEKFLIRYRDRVIKESIKEVKKLYNWENQERVLIDVYRGV